MQRRSRLVWGFLLVVSAAWILLGTFLTSEHYDGGKLGQELSSEIQSVGSEAEISALAELTLPVFFLATGLPIALAALFLLWRSRKRGAASPTVDPDSSIRRQALLVSGLALLFALFVWNVPYISSRPALHPIVATVSSSLESLLWPVRLFTTFVHEAGHSLAALLTGGQIIGFKLSPDGSGVATTAGGYRALVLPAGYLGSALFGSLLFFLANRIPKWTRGLSVALGLSIIALTVIYARPDQSGYLTAQAIGIGFGAAMVALGWLAPRMINVFALNTLAILTGLEAVKDVATLVSSSDARSGNDAAKFSQEVTPLLPGSIIALIWAAIAVSMLGAAVYFGLLKQVGREISEAVNDKT